MLEKLMQASLRNKLIVLLAAVGFLSFGTYTSSQLPVDVFPDLTAPSVTIMTEAHGMAPEEVEMLVTFPIETAVNGASGVRRVRSNSIQGLSTVWVEFDWGTDIYTARQIVTEKLQSIQASIPEEVDRPVLAPITSIMGEIMLVGLTSDSTSEMDLRTLADFDIRRRLQSVPGVSQVLLYGGETKQYQVQVNPYLLAKHDITLQQVFKAVSGSNVNATGGFFVQSGEEYLLRGIGRVRSLNDISYTVVDTRNGVPTLVRDVAEVSVAPAVRLGTASINKEDGVLLVISKQPETNTLALTRRIETILEQMKSSLPPDVRLHTEIFKQSDFIEVAVDNVTHALRDGAILVIIILFLFLGNFRTTIISVVAIPLSLILAILVLKIFDLSINTMTLGGMAIAVGVLVDDAIIYVENVYRRIRENLSMPDSERQPFDTVVAAASSEIRAPIAIATFIIIVVFVPFFFLSGIEGRMLKPLGLAYAVSIFASLLVAVTVTPAMSSWLLRSTSPAQQKDSWLVRILKRMYQPTIEYCLQHRWLVIGFAAVLVAIAMAILPFLGRSFLPEFNEGTLNISVATVPGTSLEESHRIGGMVEDILLSHPAVKSTARRTGRTELDEHSMGSHAHELEVKTDFSEHPKEQVMEELRRNLTLVPGTVITIGQPISHRIDHMLSGTRANIAVKIFGSDLYMLRRLAEQVKVQMEGMKGIVDLSVDQQTDIPQVRIRANREHMALYGLRPADLDEMIDIAFLGIRASEVYEQGGRHSLVVRYASEYRDNLEAVRSSLIDTPTGARIPLAMVADIIVDKGPNFIQRENAQRKIVVQANVTGRDLNSVVNEIESRIAANVPMPQGYFVDFGGQFESEREATRAVTAFSLISIITILVALYMEFSSFRQAALIMANLPLALIGGIMAVFLSDGIITIASLVGFITLFGIAVRNGILMVSHFNHLIDAEGKSLREAVVQGSLERLTPVLMTALCAGLALVPLALAGHKPGNEIQSPMSKVILGGLLTATFLNMIVIPVLYSMFGRRDVGEIR
jgi:CzcA family heavy metal efflux pump